LINDITKIIKNSNYLLFADDAKLYKKIKCLNDAKKLQDYLNNLYKWYTDNDMTLNIDKCSSISFSLKKNKLLFNYYLDI